MEKASAGMCSCEGRTLQTSTVGCFDNGMKLSVDTTVYAQCVFEVFNKIIMSVSKKMQFLCLSVFQGSAVTLFRWGDFEHVKIIRLLCLKPQSPTQHVKTAR